jgi:alpha-L-arabinofuranosidase
LAGLAAGERRVTIIVLTGPDADASNEHNKAPEVKPVVHETNWGADFDYAAPANSLTMFRFKK